MKLLIFILLLSLKTVVSLSPTSSPLFTIYPGQWTTSTCKGIILGPYKIINGDLNGVCADKKVGKGCRWACVHDPEGGTPCKYFKGQCIKCKRGYKLKKGICYIKK